MLDLLIIYSGCWRNTKQESNEESNQESFYKTQIILNAAISRECSSTDIHIIYYQNIGRKSEKNQIWTLVRLTNLRNFKSAWPNLIAISKRKTWIQSTVLVSSAWSKYDWELKERYQR